MNSVVKAYRDALAQQGLVDETSDYELISRIGDLAKQQAPQLFEAAPDFARDWADIREANAPSLAKEAGTAIKQGSYGLASTAVGGASLLTGSDYLRDKAKELDQKAAEFSPTIGTLEDIAPGRQGADKYLSRDALRYGVAKVGGAVPSIGEAVALGVVGGAVGSAIEPGLGTLAGAGEGVVEGLLGRGLIKSAIKRLIANSGREGVESVGEALAKRGLISEASEGAVAQAIRGGSQEVADIVSQQARQLAARRVGIAAESANSYLLNSGEIYNETPDRGLAAGLGLVSAIPDSVLPAMIVGKLFPDLSSSAAQQAAKRLVGDNAMKLARSAGVVGATTAGEGITEGFQEAINIVAKNLHEGRPADTFTEADLRRMREAAISGAAGGVVAAPGLLIDQTREAEISQPPQPAGAPAPAASPAVQLPVQPSRQSDAVAAVRAVGRLSPEEKQGRWIELQNLPARTAAEEAEYQVLKATTQQEAAAATNTPAADLSTPAAAPGVAAETPAGEVFTFEVQKPDGQAELVSARGASPDEAQRYVAEKLYGGDPGITMALQPEAAPVEPLLTARPRASTPVSVEASPIAMPAVAAAPEAAPEPKSAQEQAAAASRVAGPQYLYSFQPPERLADGRTLPGFLQVDEIINGENTRSSNVAALRKEGIELPDIPAAMPRGQHTLEQVQQFAAQNPGAPLYTTPVEPTITTAPELKISEAKPFTPGAVVVGDPSIDFRTDSLYGNQTPEQWRETLETNLRRTTRSGETGNRSETRVAVAIEGPDGQVVLSGLVLPQTTLKSSGFNGMKEPALQRMGVTRGKKRMVEMGGNAPATVEDAVRAGWRPVAVVHFEGAPQKIYQTYPDLKSFDAAWAATPKGTGRRRAPKLQIEADTQRSAEQRLQQRIDELATRLTETDNRAEQQELIAQIQPLYDQQEALLSRNQNQTGYTNETPEFRRAAEAQSAVRTEQFQLVMGRLRRQGARVDAFAREFFQQSLKSELDGRIAQLQQRIDQAESIPQKVELGRQLAILQERAGAAQQAVGVSYSPYHIAVSLEDVQNQNLNNLVTLLHEAAENLGQRLNTTTRGAVGRAIDLGLRDLAAQARGASRETGATLANTTNPFDLLAESIAQRMAREGIADTSLATSIVRWVKDLYYRVAMAVQRSFGAEPSPELALDWFENQLQREVGGDYDYRFASLLDRYLPETMTERLQRFEGARATPGGVTDFLDPVTGKIEQPIVDPITPDALEWNIAYRTEGSGDPELQIPDPEARARQYAAAQNEVQRWVEELRQKIAPTASPEAFWQMVGRGTDPRALLQQIEQRVPGAASAVIGGEQMSEVMNGQANLDARILFQKLQAQQLKRQSKLQQEINESADRLTDRARQVNLTESELRNATMHEDLLKRSARDEARDLVRASARGLDLAEQQGELAQAIREQEGLLESDPIPAQYQEFLKRVSDQQVPLFDYFKAVAALDLNAGDMTTAEIREAIRANADGDPVLARLAQNRPLLAAISTLARRNATQLDQVALGWLKNAERFVEIHRSLDDIRRATPDQLRQMMKMMDERVKARGFAERIRVNYLRQRRELQRASERMAIAEERLSVLEKARQPMADKVSELQRNAGGSYSEWQPHEGARYASMQPQQDGQWSRLERELKFSKDGSAQESDRVRSDIALNRRWLELNKERAGEKLYEQVRQQTYRLANLDVQRKYQGSWNWMLLRSVDRLVTSPSQQARQAGGAGIRINQALNQFQFILRSFPAELEGPSYRWNVAFQEVGRAAGIRDLGELGSQLFDPVSYFLNTNPGLDESAAIREATRLARSRLAKEPAPDFNEKFADLLRRTKESSEAVAKIADQFGVRVNDPRLQGELRQALPTGWLTSMRSLRGDVVKTLMADMQKAGWTLGFREKKDANGETQRVIAQATTFDSIDPVNASTPDERRDYFEGLKNSDNLRAILGRLFTTEIKQRWLEPFINKGGQEVFRYNQQPIAQLDLQNAWARSNGDVLAFIDELGATQKLEQDREGNDPVALFRLSMLRQLDGLFGMESKLAAEASQTRDMFDPMGPKTNGLGNARLSDILPPEHLAFQQFDPESTLRVLGNIAFNGAFGRNGEGMIADFRDLRNELGGMASELGRLRGTTRTARTAEAAARGYRLKDLEQADRRLKDVIQLQQQMESIFGVGNPAGPWHDLKNGMAILNAMAGQMVDNPKTGLLNAVSIAMRPFAMKSLGPATVGDTTKAYGDFLKTGFGSLLEALNINLLHSSQYAKDIAASEGQVFRELPYGVALADQGAGGKDQSTTSGRWLIHPLKMLKALQRKGVKIGFNPENPEFPRLAVIPGLGVGNTISQVAAQAGASQLAQRLETYVNAGIHYFAANPEKMNDPSYRFSPRDLGVGRLDTGVLDWYRNKLTEYNMGTLEDVAREAIPRKAKAERLLTRDQVIKLAMINANELDGASSINTTPTILQTNPILKMMMPLLRWPLWIMSTAHEGLQDSKGQANLKATLKGLGILAAFNLPVGLAFGLLMDSYDDKLLDKKANAASIDPLAAIPIVGPLAALALSDRPVMENLMSYLERAAKAGNVYGLGLDLINQFGNSFDPQSGQRQFSLDQRVLAMSQLLNFQQAIRNLISTGGIDSYANFYRPLITSLGGNGALHSIDLVNRVLGLDNQEARMVQRINAGNWLRSAGRELDMELKTGGTSDAPSALGAWTREMLLSAMANDRAGFEDSRRKALNAAREAVGDDPGVAPVAQEKEAMNRLLSSWRARDPLSVFRQKPTDAEYRRLLSYMDDSGKQAVGEAVDRYQAFSSIITPSEVQRAMNRQQSSQMRGQTLTPEQLRRQMASGMFSR